MGSGEIGGNKSVHWKVKHNSGAQHGNRDPLGGGGVNDIGAGTNHRGKFEVTLRWPTRIIAESALDAARMNIRGQGGAFYASILVDAVDRDDDRSELPNEINIDW